MTATTQHGPHPEAELLSAFAERALSAHERNHVLAHLAVCTRCRQVVALSASASELESHTLVAAAAAAPAVAAHRRPNPWWTRWRLVWIPAAVVAAFTVTVVSLNLRRTEPAGVRIEIAKQVPPSGGPPSSEQGVPTPPALTKDETPPASPDAPASSAPTRQQTPTLQPSAKAQPHLPSVAVTAAPPEPRAAYAGAAAAPRALPPGPQPVQLEPQPAQPQPPPPSATQTVTVASDQSAPETASAQPFISLQPALKPANSPLHATPPTPAAPLASPSSPASAELQAEREKKFADFNRQVDAAETTDRLSAARANPQAASVGAAVSASNTSGAAYTQPAASNHGSIASFSSAFGLSSGAGLAGTPIRLPSGLALASIASSGHLLLAVDKSGTLFLTQDSGVTWRQVARQWSGRAILVRTRNLADRRAVTTPSAPSASASSAESPAPPAPSIVFEVVNERNQVWQSADGLVWTAK
jgi:hypothetical protein